MLLPGKCFESLRKDAQIQTLLSPYPSEEAEGSTPLTGRSPKDPCGSRGTHRKQQAAASCTAHVPTEGGASVELVEAGC